MTSLRRELIHGAMRDVLSREPSNSADSVVTDPPYALTGETGQTMPGRYADNPRVSAGGFMGLAWDKELPTADDWREAYRVLKPGAHLVAFGGTRTYHRLATIIEDAGFVIRDMLGWVYLSGFPKSLDVSKAIDKRAGAKRFACPYCRDLGEAYDPLTREGPTCPACKGVPATKKRPAFAKGRGHGRDEKGGVIYRGVNGGHVGSAELPITAPATSDAALWSGWGTALKPCWENILVARKPLPHNEEMATIGSCLSTLHAKLAESISPSSHLEHAAATFVSALMNAGLAPATWGGLCAATATSPSASAIGLSLSIVSSWLDTLGATSRAESTYITSTGSSKIIDWPILSYCASQITRAFTDSKSPSLNELPSLAPTAESLFSVCRAYSNAILARAATERATALLRTNFPGGAAPANGDLHAVLEPIVLARKPFKGMTVADCVLTHGTAAMNVDGCRIPGEFVSGGAPCGRSPLYSSSDDNRDKRVDQHPLGRWPGNIIAAPGCFTPDTQRVFDLGAWFAKQEARYNAHDPYHRGVLSGLWPVPKPDASEKEAGLGAFARKKTGKRKDASWNEKNPRAMGGATERLNTHPTVKPVALMRFLARLVTPKGGTLIEPFTGSGTTLVAAIQEGFGYVAAEREAEYVEIAKARAAHALNEWEGVPLAPTGAPLPLFDAAQSGGAA